MVSTVIVASNREQLSTSVKLNDLTRNQNNLENVDLVDDATSNLAQINKANEHEQTNNPSFIKCSAIHTLEREDIPKYDYSHLVRELRDKILAEYQENQGSYAKRDIDKCRDDDWTVARYLIRQKMDVDLAFDMLKGALRFRHETLASSLRAQDFPQEFYKLGGLFPYEDDRKGNKTLHMRIRVHKKVPEIQTILESFIFYNITRVDELANGKGIAIILDCTGSGLSSADMDTLMFLISSLKLYFPKGLSYLLIHNLPWILKPFWHLAKLCIPSEYSQIVQFSDSQTIFQFIDKENLPDYMNGTCKRDYRAVPEDCTTLKQASKLWGIEKEIVAKLLLRFSSDLPKESLDQLEELDAVDEENQQENNKPEN